MPAKENRSRLAPSSPGLGRRKAPQLRHANVLFRAERVTGVGGMQAVHGTLATMALPLLLPGQ